MQNNVYPLVKSLIFHVASINYLIVLGDNFHSSKVKTA